MTLVDLTIAVADMPFFETELFDGVTGDDRDEPNGLRHDHLDLSDQSVDLDLRHHGVETIPRAEMRTGAVAAQAFDLGGRNDAPIGRIAFHLDAAGLVPAAQRVQADPERRRRLTRCIELSRHDQLSYASRAADTASI